MHFPNETPEIIIGIDNVRETPNSYVPNHRDAPDTVKQFEPGELEASRDKLFDEGSSFKPIDRSEIIGIDNVLVEIDNIIHWLQNSKAYQKFNSRLEPGVIFEGEPGTGKTLVSRYIATEAGATFINIRDFEHEGPLYKDIDIADLFKRARAKYAESKHPVVLFWDEFEGAALNREDAMPEQAATVSQLTAELDGIHGKNEGILLIGCTNFIYNIDEALKRSGRMGLQIEFHAPDRAGKQEILGHYLHQHKIAGEIDVETLSYFFDEAATAADIEEACVEAWRFAVRRILDTKAAPALNQGDLMRVFLKRLVGPPTSFINLHPKDRHKVGVHESGHALMALAFGIPVRLITVEPGKKSLGRVMTIELQEHMSTHEEVEALMRVYAGSIAAEEAAGYSPATGSTSDVQRINQLASYLVDDLTFGTRTGYYNVGAMAEVRSNLSGVFPNNSDQALKDSHTDIKNLMEHVEKQAIEVMRYVGLERLHTIAEGVCDANTMTGAQFEQLVQEIMGDGYDHLLHFSV